MPRFLAEDYLSDAIYRKQTHLTRLQLVCPEFIEKNNMQLLSESRFLYRVPWRKGQKLAFELNLHSELENDVIELSKNKTSHLNSHFLIFNGIEFHGNAESPDMVVPNSDPSSDEESLLPQNLLSHNPTAKLTTEFTMLGSSKELKSSACLLLEDFTIPLNIENRLPTLQDLCDELDFDEITDPTEEVNQIVNDFEGEKEELYYSKTLIRDIGNSEIVFEKYFKPAFRELSINNDFILINKVDYPDVFKVPSILDQKPDICHENLNIRVCKDLQKLYKSYKTTNHNLLALESLIDPAIQIKPVELPCLLKRRSDVNISEDMLLPYAKSTDTQIFTALSYLQVNKENIEMEGDNFTRYIKVAESLLKLERIPDYCGKVLKMYLPEPTFHMGHLSVKSWSDTLASLKVSDVMPTLLPLAELERSLPWDAVSHAKNIMREIKQHVYSKKLSGRDVSHYREVMSEKFSPLPLDISIEENIVMSEPNAVKVSSCVDIPTVKNNAQKSKQVNNSTNHQVIPARSLTTENYTCNKTQGGERFYKEASSNSVDHFIELLGKQKAHPVTQYGPSVSMYKSGNYQSGDLQVKRMRIALPQQKEQVPKDKVSSDKPSTLFSGSKQTNQTSSAQDCSEKIEVCITGKLLEIAVMLENETKPLLVDIAERNLIPRSCKLSLTKTDFSRFIYKQQVKLNENQKEGCAPPIDLYLAKMFHQIVSIYHLLVHVSGISSLALLHQTVQDLQGDREFLTFNGAEMYVSVLKSLLARLTKLITPGHQQQLEAVVHPKIVQLKKLLVTFYQRKVNKISGLAMLVVCSTKCRYLFAKLCQELNRPVVPSSCTLRAAAAKADSKELKAVDLLNVIKSQKINVMIVSDELIGADFPWKLFSLVIEYEHRVDSPWKNLANENGIPQKSLEALLPHNEIIPDEIASKHITNIGNRIVPSQQYVIIGSTKIAGMGQLLHLLEARFEILVVEHNLEELVNSNTHRQADFILNEGKCILLEKLSMLSATDASANIKRLLEQLACIKRKFTSCYIIMYNSDAACSNVLGGQVPKNLAILHASLKQYSLAFENFQVKALFCFTVEDMAEIIFDFTQQAYSSSQIKYENNATDRSWIKSVISKEEKFLLQLPCVNSFIAQHLMARNSWENLLHMSSDLFLSQNCWIPTRIAQDIYESLSLVLQSLHTSVSTKSNETVNCYNTNLHHAKHEVAKPCDNQFHDSYTVVDNEMYDQGDTRTDPHCDKQSVNNLIHAAKVKLDNFAIQNPSRIQKQGFRHEQFDTGQRHSHYNTYNKFNPYPVPNTSTPDHHVADPDNEFRRLTNNISVIQSCTRKPRYDGRPNGASGSVNIGVAQPIQHQPNFYPDNTKSSFSNYKRYEQAKFPHRTSAVSMTPNNRKKLLTYKKVPGSRDGQTKLTFF